MSVGRILTMSLPYSTFLHYIQAHLYVSIEGVAEDILVLEDVCLNLRKSLKTFLVIVRVD